MLSQQIKNSGSLLDSIDAVRNWRAVVLLLITLVAGALVAGLGALLGTVSFFFVFLFALLAWAVVFYGGNAVGMMVMDEARGERSRPMMSAVMASLACSHRLILVFLLIGALYLVGLLALALVLLICKIPFLGPVLYTVVFPVSAVIVGIAMFALPTVVFPLSAPSIWSGAKTMECVSQLLAIARKRLIMVLILMIAVAFISGIVAMLIGMILFFGSVTVGGMSAGILGGMGSFGMMGGMGGGMGGMPMGMGMGGLGGHAMAAMIGGGVLYAAAFTLPGMVYLRGACTVYQRAIDGLDLASEQAAMDGKIAAARAKAREMQEQAQAQAQKYAQQGTVVVPPPAAAAPAPYTPPPAPAPYMPPAPPVQAAPVAPPVFVPPVVTVQPPAPAHPPAPVSPPPYVAPPYVPPPAPVQPPPAPPVFVPPPPPVFTPPPPPVFQPPPAPAYTPPPAPAVVPPAPALAPDVPMVLKCPKCGAPYLPGDSFCGECGNKLR